MRPCNGHVSSESWSTAVHWPRRVDLPQSAARRNVPATPDYPPRPLAARDRTPRPAAAAHQPACRPLDSTTPQRSAARTEQAPLRTRTPPHARVWCGVRCAGPASAAAAGARHGPRPGPVPSRRAAHLKITPLRACDREGAAAASRGSHVLSALPCQPPTPASHPCRLLLLRCCRRCLRAGAPFPTLF